MIIELFGGNEFVSINSFDYFQESAPLKGGRGSASMVVKCKLCSRENSIGNVYQTFDLWHPLQETTFENIVAKREISHDVQF